MYKALCLVVNIKIDMIPVLFLKEGQWILQY